MGVKMKIFKMEKHKYQMTLTGEWTLGGKKVSDPEQINRDYLIRKRGEKILYKTIETLWPMRPFKWSNIQVTRFSVGEKKKEDRTEKNMKINDQKYP